ncbi:hypothetical protein M501DRAFT_1056554 [Patellaria atrata CBS 101060]|uniref:PARP-type domain-containing protein n=1 Tax=Patellaria atrata CBS 101060 TaxID=1346257 RepID=A0A9P4SCL4_9PEZI|nr:hypothetical protein M501DRAFT_1056554 [Patellaria atrata CBS 101060]
MALTKTTKQSTKLSDTSLVEDDTPKHTIQHASSTVAVCQKAECKRSNTIIEAGELRFGTWTYFQLEEKYIWRWKHWRCISKAQLRTFIEIADENPEDAPGWGVIDDASQEQVRAAFALGHVPDRTFVGQRGPDEGDPIKVDLATSNRSSCIGSLCKNQGIRIAKGDLMLCIPSFFQEHLTFKFKHWDCISPKELRQVKARVQSGNLDGFDDLDEAAQALIKKDVETGEVTKRPPGELSGAVEAKKKNKEAPQSPKRKRKVDKDADAEVANVASPTKVLKIPAEIDGADESTSFEDPEVDAAVDDNTAKLREIHINKSPVNPPSTLASQHESEGIDMPSTAEDAQDVNVPLTTEEPMDTKLSRNDADTIALSQNGVEQNTKKKRLKAPKDLKADTAVSRTTRSGRTVKNSYAE